MHCCNINKSRRGDFFWFTWYKCCYYYYYYYYTHSYNRNYP